MIEQPAPKADALPGCAIPRQSASASKHSRNHRGSETSPAATRNEIASAGRFGNRKFPRTARHRRSFAPCLRCARRRQERPEEPGSPRHARSGAFARIVARNGRTASALSTAAGKRYTPGQGMESRITALTG